MYPPETRRRTRRKPANYFRHHGVVTIFFYGTYANILYSGAGGGSARGYIRKKKTTATTWAGLKHLGLEIHLDLLNYMARHAYARLSKGWSGSKKLVVQDIKLKLYATPAVGDTLLAGLKKKKIQPIDGCLALKP